MEPVSTFEYDNGLVGRIFFDEDAPNPRTEFDCHLGTMVCWHSRYNLGDEQPELSADDFQRSLAEDVDPTVYDRIEYWDHGPGWETLIRRHPCTEQSSYCSAEAVKAADQRVEAIIAKAIEEHYIVLPLYLYDHSGITISTGPFSCPWDSGQVGWIYVSIEQVKKEFGWKRLTRDRRQQIVQILEKEVEEYDQYLTGQVFEYVLEGNSEEIVDSCGGFFGEEYCEQELQAAAERTVQRIKEELAIEIAEEVNV